MDCCNDLTSANVFNMWSHDYDSSFNNCCLLWGNHTMTGEGSHIFASFGEAPPVWKYWSTVLVRIGSLVTKQTFSCPASLSTFGQPCPIYIWQKCLWHSISEHALTSHTLTEVIKKKTQNFIILQYFFIFFVLCVTRTCIYQNLWNRTKVRSFNNCQCL